MKKPETNLVEPKLGIIPYTHSHRRKLPKVKGARNNHLSPQIAKFPPLGSRRISGEQEPSRKYEWFPTPIEDTNNSRICWRLQLSSETKIRIMLLWMDLTSLMRMTTPDWYFLKLQAIWLVQKNQWGRKEELFILVCSQSVFKTVMMLLRGNGTGRKNSERIQRVHFQVNRMLPISCAWTYEKHGTIVWYNFFDMISVDMLWKPVGIY